MWSGIEPPCASFAEEVAGSGIYRVEPEDDGSRNFHMLGDGSDIPNSPYFVLIEEAWIARLDPSVVENVASAYGMRLLFDFQPTRSSLTQRVSRLLTHVR